MTIKHYLLFRNLIQLLIIVLVINYKSISTQTICSVKEKSNYDKEHQPCDNGVSTNSAAIKNSLDNINKTELTGEDKNWLGTNFKYFLNSIKGISKAMKIIPVVNNEFNVKFDQRQRKDGYRKTDPVEHPYAVLLHITFVNGKNTSCSGSLITAEWVLTAAHCIYDDDPAARAHSMWVYAGGNSLAEVEDFLLKNVSLPSTAQIIPSEKHLYPEEYPRKTFGFDIALVKTSKKFNMTITVNTIKLAAKPWRHVGYRSCTTTGFGLVQDEYTSADDTVRKTIPLEVKKPCICNFMVKITTVIDGDEASAANKLLCAKPRQDYGICSGDSGGGVVCDDEGEMKIWGTNQLTTGFVDVKYCEVNILKFGLGIRFDKCADKNVVSMFHDPFPHLPWLNKYVGLYSEEEMYQIMKQNNSAAMIRSLNSVFVTTIYFVYFISKLV